MSLNFWKIKSCLFSLMILLICWDSSSTLDSIVLIRALNSLSSFFMLSSFVLITAVLCFLFWISAISTEKVYIWDILSVRDSTELTDVIVVVACLRCVKLGVTKDQTKVYFDLFLLVCFDISKFLIVNNTGCAWGTTFGVFELYSFVWDFCTKHFWFSSLDSGEFLIWW